jgi:hypothetical protein
MQAERKKQRPLLDAAKFAPESSVRVGAAAHLGVRIHT